MTNETAVATKKESILAVTTEPTFNLPVLVCPTEALEVMAENMEGMGEFKFEKIKMPSGGGIAFTVFDEAGEEQPVKELRGILLDKYPFRSWYIKAFDEKTPDDDNVPDCFSEDNIHGSGCAEAGIPAGQLCATCQKGQWGSDRRGGKGKDCADKIRIHLLMEGEMFPKYIDTPPTSLGNFKDYVVRLSNKMKPVNGVVTTIKLEKAKSGGGVEFSRMVFVKAADLTKDERVAMRSYIKTLLPSMRKITRESIADDVVSGSGAGTIIEAQVVAGAEAGDDQPY